MGRKNEALLGPTELPYQNEQSYSECRLVSIWNAARFWGLSSLVPRMGTAAYKRTCEKAMAIHGAALDTSDELRRLGLDTHPLRWRLSCIIENLPCEMKVFCERGYHSVLAVSYKKGRKPWTSRFFVANWRKKGKADWITWGEILASANLDKNPLLIAPMRMIRNMRLSERWKSRGRLDRGPGAGPADDRTGAASHAAREPRRDGQRETAGPLGRPGGPRAGMALRQVLWHGLLRPSRIASANPVWHPEEGTGP